MCLDRTADEVGLNFWNNNLIVGNSTGVNMACDFIFSDEFKSHNYSDADYIRHLYTAMMGREADDGGLNYWLGVLAQSSREDVFKGFAGSAEYKSICSSYAVYYGNIADLKI